MTPVILIRVILNLLRMSQRPEHPSSSKWPSIGGRCRRKRLLKVCRRKSQLIRPRHHRNLVIILSESRSQIRRISASALIRKLGY